METPSIKIIKTELKNRSKDDLEQLCLLLAKFKKENKEFLSYLLLESENEASFIESVKEEIEHLFEEITTSNIYLIKKSVRKILRILRKYIRFSKIKETEVELMLHFCSEMLKIQPSIKRDKVLKNIYLNQIASVQKSINALHEDLQYDYNLMLSELE